MRRLSLVLVFLVVTAVDRHVAQEQPVPDAARRQAQMEIDALEHASSLRPEDAATHRALALYLKDIMDQQGRIASACVLRSAPGLDDAALDAVSGWEFRPTLLNGVAVPVIVTVTVNFTLG